MHRRTSISPVSPLAILTRAAVAGVATLLGVAITLALAPVVQAQSPTTQPPASREPVSLSGPRIGVTYLSPGVLDVAKDNGVDIAPVITQFGWQFERRIFTASNGLTAMTEWVLLAGGLEQGAFLPSVSWLVGMRGPSGAEFGVGPNLTGAGVALAIAAGVNFRVQELNLPLNLAVVPSRSGVRISLLGGFTLLR